MKLGQRRQTLPVVASLWDATLPIRGGQLADGRAGALQDELDVAGVLTPLVEGHHGVFVRCQVALCLAPFLDQSVPASAPYDKAKPFIHALLNNLNPGKLFSDPKQSDRTTADVVVSDDRVSVFVVSLCVLLPILTWAELPHDMFMSRTSLVTAAVGQYFSR